MRVSAGRGLSNRFDSHNSHNKQHTRVIKNALFFMKKKTLSPTRHVLETSHRTRPKIDSGDASLLMGGINWTRLDFARDDNELGPQLGETITRRAAS
jgi:hypothetical protein